MRLLPRRPHLQRASPAVDNLREMGPLASLPKPVRTLLETAITLVVALGIAWLGQAFVVKPYRVPTPSMVPTLEPGDRVLADRISLDFENPGRGQIVVFHPPHCKSGHNDASGVCSSPQLDLRDGLAGTTYVKRVIGLPGETVWADHGHVWIKDPGKKAFELHESYTDGKPTTRLPRQTIPKGYYLMLGDSRVISDDSRTWGLEPRSGMIGIARVRYWPLDRLGLL
jgi:signal peptidase I